MDANFKKFKRKVWFDILVKCACWGLAAGLTALVAVILPCKLYGINIWWLYYVLIAFGGIVIGGGTAFLFLRTNDKKIAKRLDAELNLNERVQTAYAYRGEESDILDLQRGNTSAVLGGISVRALPFKNIVATVLCGVIALADIVALPLILNFVPSVHAESEKQEPAPEPPRPVTDWEWAALDDLIDYVKASKKADAVVKTGIVLELEGLKSILLDGVSASSLSLFVQNTVSNIRNVVKDANDRGISDEQQAFNSEEETYVINRLYEIFSIQRPGSGGDGGDEQNPGDGGDEGKKPGEAGDTGYEVNVTEVPFFDPEKGYVNVSDSETRVKYYNRVQAAFEEGTISREEWEYIMVTYFADLVAKE